MRRLFNLPILFMFVLSVLASPVAQAGPAESSPPPQFRAFWVDAFGPGIYTEAQIDQLVAEAKAANMNAIVAQVGRRGDCFCNRAIMPRTQAAIDPMPFDPLQSLIDKAHAQGLQVHAWVIATAIWNSVTPPLDPNHVFNTHGISQTLENNWLMLRYDGANRAGADYLLDPGHPDAADYIVKMYTSIVANYDVDGINFDRIRYPDYNLVISGTTVPSWGYNPVAVARFQAATGRTDIPAPSDPDWMQWRRDQITNIVRRVYLESYALKPHVRISADTITYGYGPQSVTGGYEGTRTYGEVLQDWRGWMQEGILDLNIPMNYKREHVTTEPGNNQQRMYMEWNEFIKDNQYNRQAAIGSAAYLNYITGTVAQVRKALEPSAAGHPSYGYVAYSYRVPDALAYAGQRTGDASRVELIRALTQPSEYDPITPPVLAAPTTVPDMPWKTQPTKGHLMGTVKTPEGTPFDQVRVDLYRHQGNTYIGSAITDGNGWFGFVDLAPGRYKVRVDPARAHGPHHLRNVTVVVGQVAVVELTPFAWGQEGHRHGPRRDGFDPLEPLAWPNGER